MRVLTWNLWWRFGAHWRERQREILATLRAARPDVAGLQEVWGGRDTNQAQVLADELGLYAVYAAPSLPPAPSPPETGDQADVEVGVAVLSRWPILDVQQHELPAGERPGVTALAVAVDHPQAPLRVVTSCLEWERGLHDVRRAQAHALAAIVDSMSGPVFLAADLNAPPDAPELKPLTELMVDAWVVANGPGHSATLSSANPLASREDWQLDRRIDYVLARAGDPTHSLVVEQAFLVGDREAAISPSDHYGVVADFRV